MAFHISIGSLAAAGGGITVAGVMGSSGLPLVARTVGPTGASPGVCGAALHTERDILAEGFVMLGMGMDGTREEVHRST